MLQDLELMPIDSLALLRSKSGFEFACAEGLSALDEALGSGRREALLTKFNSILYFASRENRTDEHAMLTLDTQDSFQTQTTGTGSADVQVLESVFEVQQRARRIS